MCAAELKLIETSSINFELVNETYGAPPLKTPSTHAITVNVQTGPKEKTETDIYTLLTEDGYLKLTTRHLRGEFKAKMTADEFRNGGWLQRTQTRTSVDTLLSGVVGFQIVTDSNGGAKFLLGGFALLEAILGFFCFAVSAHLLGIILLTCALFSKIVIANLKPAHHFSFIVTGKEYAINISEEKVPAARKFITYLREAKKEFEKGI